MGILARAADEGLLWYNPWQRGLAPAGWFFTSAVSMIKKIEAVFDGSVLRPVEPLAIEPNTHVTITVDVPETKPPRHGSFLDTAQSLNLDGPADWSENVDSYLYGGDVPSDG